MHGLPQSRGFADEWEKTKAPDKAGDFADVFVAAETVDQCRAQNDPFDLICGSPCGDAVFAFNQLLHNLLFFNIGRLSFGNTAG